MGSIVAEEERLIVIVNLGWLNIHSDCFIGFSLLIVKEEGRKETFPMLWLIGTK